MSGRRNPPRRQQPRIRGARGMVKISGRRTCPCGKVRFPSEYDAEKATARLRKEAEAEGRRPPVRVYPCRQCEGWHMTGEDYRSSQ